MNSGNSEPLRARVGSTNRHSDGIYYDIAKTMIHEQNVPTRHNFDIAVLKLSKPLSFDAKVRAIPLGTSYSAGQKALATGWGRLSEGGPPSDYLMKVELPIINHAECMKIYHAEGLSVDQLCAGYPEGGKSTCQGDSGGPLIYDNKLIGIVSWATGCARPGLPTVFADVTYLKKWVESSMKKLNSKKRNHLY